MTTLKRASTELFRRSPDEMFPSLSALKEHCALGRSQSQDRWHPPANVSLRGDDVLSLSLKGEGVFSLNDWSFSQLCRLAGVAKDTVNRLSPPTASQVFQETLPRSGDKPLQVLTEEQRIRSLHGTQYTRLWNDDLIRVLMEFDDFEPPHTAFNGGTGLFAGEQDLFCFLIDPAGWVEIGEQAFCPGFFVWNSEVGRRSLGIQTFFFQSVCANHIVWDATDVVEWKRKHTANVAEGLTKIREIIASLVRRRDERRDGFAKIIRKAMSEKLGEDSEQALKLLRSKGISRAVAKKAVAISAQNGGFSVWSIVDALTRLSHEQTQFVGLRTEADQKASALLSLVA